MEIGAWRKTSAIVSCYFTLLTRVKYICTGVIYTQYTIELKKVKKEKKQI